MVFMEKHILSNVTLQADDERYRKLVEQVSDWIWEVDANGVYTYASPQIEQILGYTPDEIIGRTPFDLMEPDEGERIGPIFQYHVANKLPINSLENINLHRDGHEVILETSGSPILNDEGECIGYIGVDRDITERKLIEQKQKQLIEILDASPSFIATLDINGNSFYYNPAARNILGITEENIQSVTSRWLTDFIKNEGIPTAIEKGYWKGETTVINGEGIEIPVSHMLVAHKTENGTVEFLSTIAHDITERKELEKVIYNQAHYDQLTNLPNRRFLHKKMATIIEDTTDKKRVAFLFMDLDNFKSINDSLGHEIGDQLLVMTAAHLESYVEKNDFICRYGGDEFILILEDIWDIESIKEKTQRILEAFKQPFEIEGHTISVTGSIGISVYPDDGKDFLSLITKADNAMYRIKQDGKNNFSIE